MCLSNEQEEKEVLLRAWVRNHLIGLLEILAGIARENNIQLEVRIDIDIYEMAAEPMGDQVLLSYALAFKDAAVLWEAVPDIICVENSKCYGTGHIDKENFRKSFENLVELFVPIAWDI